MDAIRSGQNLTKNVFAISEKLNAQIRSHAQANRNANDGISMVQTAEGGLDEVSNILTRLRELSIQSSSDTVGDVERSFTDMEYQNLKQEVERIAQVTEFNGIKLLSGEGEMLDFQIGSNNDDFQDRISYDSASQNAKLDSLGIEKNFTNRLKYSKAKTFASIVSGTGVKSFLNNIVSKISVALFILLPIFALFFKFIYIRRKYTYVEHLIFIFHTQTVFFLIFSFYVIFEIIWHKKIEANGSTVMSVLLLFFMVYLFIAMKRFYKQGFFKTAVKYILANISFFMLSTLGIAVLTVIIFILN